MEGFLSTSLEEEQAMKIFKQFGKDSIIEVHVKANELGGGLDWGFADISHCSRIPEEKEVLFNPINIFKVKNCLKDQEKEYKQ